MKAQAAHTLSDKEILNEALTMEKTGCIDRIRLNSLNSNYYSRNKKTIAMALTEKGL